MKYNIILGIVIIAMSVQLSSCKNDKTIEKKEGIINKAPDTVFDSKNPYYLFIKKNHPEAFKNNELIYFKEEDIDLDGKKEAIVALGELSKEDEMETSVNQIFLLRNVSGEIKEIENNFGYSNITKVEFVSLNEMKQKFISLSIIKSGSSYGFVLFELTGNKAHQLFWIVPSGEGSCYLVDKNNDGKYDGYVKSFRFSDTVDYEVEESYVFKDKEFKPLETHVKISNYPTTIKELVLQYISLRSLEIQESSEVNERLKQICTDQTASAIKWNKDVWEDACSKYHDESEKIIEIEMKEDNKTAIVSYVDEAGKKYQCQFEVEKNANQWQITKVTITKNGDDELNK